MASTTDELLAEIAAAIGSDPSCPLRESRRNAVPGEGSSTAKVVFVGEAPGEEEDKTGRPFVGRSGMLLRRTIEEVGMQPEEYWIGNIVKCRPPGNRDPTTEEVEHCKHYIFAQLVLLQPKVIVPLGRHSLHLLVDPKLQISKWRGKPIRKDGQMYLPTYHPSAILRSGNTMLPEFRRDIVAAWKLANIS